MTDSNQTAATETTIREALHPGIRFLDTGDVVEIRTDYECWHADEAALRAALDLPAPGASDDGSAASNAYQALCDAVEAA
jgi:hypothetical protein